jgi:hypothetical protein
MLAAKGAGASAVAPAGWFRLWSASLRNGWRTPTVKRLQNGAGVGREPELNQQGDVAEWLKATVC